MLGPKPSGKPCSKLSNSTLTGAAVPSVCCIACFPCPRPLISPGLSVMAGLVRAIHVLICRQGERANQALLDQALFLVIADRAGMQRHRAAGGGGLELDLLAGGMRVGEFRQRFEDEPGH